MVPTRVPTRSRTGWRAGRRAGRRTRCAGPLAVTAAFAALAGSCAATGCSPAPARTAELPSFDSARAWRDLQAQVAIGPRPAGSPGAEATRVYIEEQLAAAGLDSVRESFTAETPIGPVEMANVVVDLPAADDPAGKAPIVVLCAHYETKRTDFEFVGANDGASGVAALLELARGLARAPRPVAYRLVFLDGEEAMRWAWRDPDNRYGSRHHVAELKRTGLIGRVQACVVLDLVADRDLRLTTDLASDERLLEAFFSAAREAGLGQHVDGARIAVRDDHLSFMAEGIRSVDLIDLEYGPGNEYWHSADDTLEHVSQASLEVIGRIVLAGLPKVEALVRERSR